MSNERDILIVSVIGILFSMFQILQQLLHYYNPQMQKYVVRLILMVPIYLVCTLLQLFLEKEYTEIKIIRDCYEGFVVYSFFSLVNQYIGEEQVIRNLLKTKSMNMFPPPLCFWKCDPTIDGFLEYTKIGVLQYVVIRITTTFLGLILDFLEKDTKIVLVLNGIGMSLAMFTLVNYYLVVREDIERYRPVLQFFSVKFVIFLGFYQNLVLKSAGIENPREIENILTAIEMLIASILHFKAFNYEIFSQAQSEQDLRALDFSDSVRDAFSWLDLNSDLKFLWQFIKSRFTRSSIENLGRGFTRINSEEWQDIRLFNPYVEEIDQGLSDLRG